MGQRSDEIIRMPYIRHERVQELRRQIAMGVYETPDKMEIALERLLRAIGLRP